MTQCWRRTARRLGWDRNPLRRRIDRAEAVVLATLAAALVIAAPLLATFAGHVAGAAAVREQHAERGWYQVPAVLLQNAGQAVITSGEMDMAWVRARWTERGGQHRTGLVPAAPGAEAGQRVQIWLTPAGQLTSPRLGAADVRNRVLDAMGLAVTGWLAVIGLAAASVRVLADRRRLAGWQREWDAAGPRWSHHG
jgi:hypothetical protein